MRSLRLLMSALAVLACAATSAAAEQRIALVIGNSSYEFARPLKNPLRDANAVGSALRSAGFEVHSASNLRRADMPRVLRDFSARVAEKGNRTVALVFYTGHAMQVDGKSFLIPVDARIGSEADVAREGVLLSDVVNSVSSRPGALRIMIVDASRPNPFLSTQFAGRGLAIVPAPANTILAYSSAPGKLADEGNGPNSPYTAALVRTIQERGLPIEEVFKRVRVSVNKATNGQQMPWDSSSLTSSFTFDRIASR
jgi:uncharacterized caspase-like protein